MPAYKVSVTQEVIHAESPLEAAMRFRVLDKHAFVTIVVVGPDTESQIQEFDPLAVDRELRNA